MHVGITIQLAHSALGHPLQQIWSVRLMRAFHKFHAIVSHHQLAYGIFCIIEVHIFTYEQSC